MHLEKQILGAQARVGAPWHSNSVSTAMPEHMGTNSPGILPLPLPTGSSFQDKTRETQPHFSP